MMSDLVENQTPLTQREWVWPVAFDRLLQMNLKHERYVMQLENNIMLIPHPGLQLYRLQANGISYGYSGESAQP